VSLQQRPEIDLPHHILFIAFKNKFITPKDPTTTQELISRLMTEYPHIFPNSTKISYTIAMMKTEGYVAEKQVIDKEGYEKCIKEYLAEHPKASENRARKECVRKLGYKSILYITEGGVVEYCGRVKPYVRGAVTAVRVADATTGAERKILRGPRVNLKILEVCDTYRAEGEAV
jgi:ribosomal protein S8